MTSHEQFVQDEYDRVVLEAGDDGMKPGEATELAADALAKAIRNEEIDAIGVDEYADAVAARTIGGLRSRRRSSLTKAAQIVADILAGVTTLGEDDPLLTEAYPGSSEAIDKSLRFWTRDDWQTATMTRYRKAAEATAAAVTFDEITQTIIGLLHGKTTGEALGFTS